LCICRHILRPAPYSTRIKSPAMNNFGATKTRKLAFITITAELLTDDAALWAAFGTQEFWQIIGLSLWVSGSASVAATIIGLPAGVALVVWKFPARSALIGATNALLGLPPVVVGLALYLLLSHSGPLGFLNLLFTPTAMTIAQAVLALPIV